MVLVVQKGCDSGLTSGKVHIEARLTRLTSIAQSSAPHAFLFDRIQNRRAVKMMSKGSGTRVASAIGYDVGAMLIQNASDKTKMGRTSDSLAKQRWLW